MSKYLPGIFLLIATGLLTLLAVSISPSGLVWATYHLPEGGGTENAIEKKCDSGCQDKLNEVPYVPPSDAELAQKGGKVLVDPETGERVGWVDPTDGTCKKGCYTDSDDDDGDDDDDDTYPSPPGPPTDCSNYGRDYNIACTYTWQCCKQVCSTIDPPIKCTDQCTGDPPTCKKVCTDPPPYQECSEDCDNGHSTRAAPNSSPSSCPSGRYVAHEGESCESEPSCSAGFSPGSPTVERNQSQRLDLTINDNNGGVCRVDYSSNDTDIASVSPASQSNPAWRTTGRSTGTFPGIAQILADIFMGNRYYSTSQTCSATASLAVNPNCEDVNNIALTPSQMQAGDNGVVSGNIVNLFGSGIANFSANPSGILTFNPVTVNANGSSFNTSVTAASSGTVEISASIDVLGKNNQPRVNDKCEGKTLVDVKITAPVAWWQTKDADVWAKSGSINSQIPGTYNLAGDGWCDGRYFSCRGAGGYPGVANAPGGGTFRMGTVSGKGWLATSGYSGPTYNYQWFAGQIPSDVTVVDLPDTINGGTLASGTNPGHGYLWFRRNGNLTIDSHVPMGGNKAVLFVTGNLTIKGTIALNDGSGFFMAVVGGNINIDPSVYHTGGETPSGNAGPGLEGLFVADGTIYTGSKPGPSEADEQLYIRGSLAANGGITLERDLDPQHLDPNLANKRNEKTPAEAVEYAPDLFFTFPRDLMGSRVTWSEVAP